MPRRDVDAIDLLATIVGRTPAQASRLGERRRIVSVTLNRGYFAILRFAMPLGRAASPLRHSVGRAAIMEAIHRRLLGRVFRVDM